MYLLALETAFGKFSLALFKGSKLVDNFQSLDDNQQAEQLIPELEKFLAKNNIDYKNLEYLACGIGPGSFTGLRTGIATAKGIALATTIKLIGVSSLEAAAQKQGGGKIHLDAHRGDAYFQEFDSTIKPISEPELIIYQGPFSTLPNAADFGEYALKNLTPNTNDLTPLYIRKPDAKLQPKKSRT